MSCNCTIRVWDPMQFNAGDKTGLSNWLPRHAMLCMLSQGTHRVTDWVWLPMAGKPPSATSWRKPWSLQCLDSAIFQSWCSYSSPINFTHVRCSLVWAEVWCQSMLLQCWGNDQCHGLLLLLLRSSYNMRRENSTNFDSCPSHAAAACLIQWRTKRCRVTEPFNKHIKA